MLSLPQVNAVTDTATLLVVDDIPDNLRLLGQLLSQEGYRVRKSRSGAIALQAARLEPPDLVLLDILMPEMDGYQVCRHLKANPLTAAIPVIFLSALNQTESKTRAFAQGGADYITKPFEGAEVLARVQHQITLRRQQRLLEEHNRQLQGEIIRRHQVEAQLQRQVRQGQFLAQITEQIHAAPDLDHLFKQVATAIQAELQVDRVLIYSLDVSGPYRLRAEALGQGRASAGVDPPFTTRPYPAIALAPACRVITHLSQLPSHDPAYLPLVALGVQAYVTLPICHQEDCLGLLVLHHCQQPRPWQPTELILLGQIARQMGIAARQQHLLAQLQRANTELRQQSRIDPLTQVGNRRYLDEYLHQAWTLEDQKGGDVLSLLLIDIDHFKLYNDTYGHPEGDRCLRLVAQVLREAVKRPHDRVFRYGGEEFALVLPHTKRIGAQRISDRIQQLLAQRQILHTASPISPYLTVSIGGVSSTAPFPETISDYICRADQALYRAKAEGRNQIRWAE
ncbi:diguanylate cyclase domain-containing protein [Leptolyngbya sp. PCC 6406]|uniref:diguanylate cyclase domain-containing protein n=1 Tax=Leptolyngbya sp. PCC 6406 TaxID=1173264 RepID=UPI0002ACBAF2|nr:diguanylate cyclase [Leptolyngbya sp. PCC 6406]